MSNFATQYSGVFDSFCYPGFLCMPWVSIFHSKLQRAVYIAALEETPRVKAIRFALEPGLAERRADGNWPRRDMPRARYAAMFARCYIELDAHGLDRLAALDRPLPALKNVK